MPKTKSIEDRAQVWSYGGGTQSIAIAVMILQGKLPRPECIVIADTGREASATWDYLDEYVQPALSEIDLTVEIAPHELATVDLYSTKGKILMPLFTAGGDGKLPTYCSTEWKARPVKRYLRQKGYGPEKPVAQWLGMSTDEKDRLTPNNTAKWIANRYPLCFPPKNWPAEPMRRIDCKRVVMEHGWPEPPKSSCWMCPHRSNRQWRGLPEDEKQKAVALERELQEHDDNVFLHHSGVPLDEVDLSDNSDPDLFEGTGCETGYCFV